MWPASPTAVPAPDRFFFLLFTSQDILKAPRATHTWAVMVRTQDGRILDAPSISWMPADLKIKPLYLFVEPARNLSYDFTIQWTRNATRERISLWGPYEADPQLYERFLARKAVLESGALGYQCLDFLGEAAAQGNGVNCIHALTPVHGLAPGDVLQRYGNDSGRFISQTLVRRKMARPIPRTMNGSFPRWVSMERRSIDRRNFRCRVPPGIAASSRRIRHQAFDSGLIVGIAHGLFSGWR